MELPILHGKLFTDEPEPKPVPEPAGIPELLLALKNAPTPTIDSKGSLVPKIQTPVSAGKRIRIRRKPPRFR